MPLTVNLTILPDTFTVCKLPPTDAIPTWATTGRFVSITRTVEELSIVCLDAQIPPDVTAERNWHALRVNGTLDFALIGILAALTVPLAEAGISVFAISTFDTDYLLVKADKLEQAINALTSAGHRIQR